MERFLRKLSLSLARSTSRRDFLAGLARGAIGLGLGAAAFLGGERMVRAAPINCMDMYKTCGTTNPCGRDTTDYSSGVCIDNAPLCGALPTPETCGTTSFSPCPAGRTESSRWVCCCNPVDYIGDKMICVICRRDGVASCKCALTNPPDDNGCD